ncbi:MAG TPA: glycosyltransferase family 4 protein [Sphingomicrobium sp.]|nr:glycosyltransferase family 4 protein [Sphingomicrobium sp.]
MRILYLTQWFEPEPNIIKGLAFVTELQAAGHEVTVVTGLPNYPTGRIYPGYRLRLIQHEEIDGVRIVRLPLYPSHDSSAVRRSLTFLSFFLSALAYCLFRAGRYDLAYVYHPPITVGLAAALAGCVRKLPFVLDVQDLWPDTVATTGLRGAGMLAGPLGFACWFVYRRSELIIAQSSGMCRALVERGVPERKISTIYNWAVQEDTRSSLRDANEEGGRFAIVYAGNFGRAQGLATVVAAAELLSRRRQDIDIRLIGDGVEAEALRKKVRGITGISIEPRISPAELDDVVAGSDALLLHLRDEPLFRITVPSKTQAYLSYGRPIVAAVGGEAADLLGRSCAAIVVAPDDPVALSEAIAEMADLSLERRESMGAAGRRFYLDNLSFASGMSSTLATVDAAMSRAVG